jgi:hypothetical protein
MQRSSRAWPSEFRQRRGMLFIDVYTSVEPFYSGWLGISGFGLEFWSRGNDLIFYTENSYIFHFKATAYGTMYLMLGPLKANAPYYGWSLFLVPI